MQYRFLLGEHTLFFFIFTQVLQLALFFLAWYLTFPEMLRAQIALGAFPLLIAFLITHLGWGFFEFFLHRYVLHRPTVPFLAIFAEKHNAHHALTYVRAVEKDGQHVIENAYPITEMNQREFSIFPAWALVAFFAVGTPALFGLQLLLPALPIFLGGYLAAFVTYVGYEIIHAFEHRSYELWWKPRIESSRFGRLYQAAYAFHLTHHLSPRSNESIGGFLGFPLADWLFGTWKTTSTPLTHGASIAFSDLQVPKGYLLIRILDRILPNSKRAERPK